MCLAPVKGLEKKHDETEKIKPHSTDNGNTAEYLDKNSEKRTIYSNRYDGVTLFRNAWQRVGGGCKPILRGRAVSLPS